MKNSLGQIEGWGRLRNCETKADSKEKGTYVLHPPRSFAHTSAAIRSQDRVINGSYFQGLMSINAMQRLRPRHQVLQRPVNAIKSEDKLSIWSELLY